MIINIDINNENMFYANYLLFLWDNNKLFGFRVLFLIQGRGAILNIVYTSLLIISMLVLLVAWPKLRARQGSKQVNDAIK